jgi:hypothetical protein
MDAEIKLDRLRIVSGTTAEVELELNRLLDDYTAITWAFYDCGGVPTASVVLLNNSEMRKAAFLQAGQVRRN